MPAESPAPSIAPRHLPGDRDPTVSAALVYAAQFGAMGLFYPIFPVWLGTRGFDPAQISLAMSLPLLARFAIAPAVGYVADGMEDRRPLLAGLVLGTLALAVTLPFLGGFYPILCVAALAMMIWQASPPLIDATVVSLVRRGLVRDYGRTRLWGSVSYAVVTLLAGALLETSGVDAVFWAFVLGLGGLVGASVLLPSGAPQRREQPRQRIDLLRRPTLLALFVAVAVIMASQAMFQYFGSVHFLALGYPRWSVGMLWTLSVSAEIVMFWLGPPALNRIGPFGLLVIAALVSVVRWIGMGFDPPLWGAALLQLMHAASFSCTYLGLMALIPRLAPDSIGAQAQSAYVTLSGLTMALTVLATGPVYSVLGGGTYFFSALLAAAGFILLLAVRRRVAEAPPEA